MAIRSPLHKMSITLSVYTDNAKLRCFALHNVYDFTGYLQSRQPDNSFVIFYILQNVAKFRETA